MKTSTLEQARKDFEHGVYNMTDNGKCTGCGNCCSNILPMTDKEIEVIRRYIKKNHIKERKQCIEEMAELAQAINKFWRKQLKCGLFTVEEIRNYGEGVSSLSELKDTDGYKNLVEEMADVQITLWQLEYLLNADTSIIIQQKLDRQIERIERE